MAQQNRKQARRSQPASTHPQFGALVTMWFAALFGLGSLAVKPSLIEAQILASRLDTLIPFVAPPLSMTGRIVLAVLFAAIGAIVGAGVARLIAPAKVGAGESCTVAAPHETDPHALALYGFELAEPAEAPAADDLAPKTGSAPEVAVPDVPAVSALVHDVLEDGLAAVVPTDAEAEPAAFLDVRPLESTSIRHAAKLPEGSGAQRIASGALGDLSPVEMLERLGLSLQQRDRGGAAAPSVTVTYAATPQEREIGFGDFDDFCDLREEAEPARLPTPSLAFQPLATLTPMARYAAGDVDTDEDDESEGENDVCEEVYSSLLRASRPADPGLRLTSGGHAENGGQSGGEAPGPDLEIELAPGGRVAKLQRLSRDG